ncbi:MAG TPA: efflux RND transporter permease subunit [Opitutaceae bacterium]|nr:efflux RND transporter permease subunit [Opitutaceae bacterium]
MSTPSPTRRLFLRPLLWVLIFGALLAYGLYAFWRIPVEVLPRFEFPQISVVAHVPGATASELETLVAWPLEGQLLALPGLVNTRTVMGNGTVEVDVRFQTGTNAQFDLQAVNGAIDRARAQLPASVQPLAEIMGNAINEVADYTAAIPPEIAPAAVQRDILATVVPALRAVPGVQRVEVYGAGDAALWVQPDLAALHRFGVPVTAIVQALRDAVLLEPGGYVSLGHQDVLIEARALPSHIADLEQLPVATASGPVPLGSLARIVRAGMPTHNSVRLDGRPAIALTVFKQPDSSTVPVTDAIQATLDQTQAQLPAGVRWVRTYNQGHLVHLVGVDLGRNLVIGGILAIGVLFWILGAGRGIGILAFSIPLSLLLGIAALHALGQTLNLMTLGALTVAVGLLADDAIIVLESIYHCWEQGDAHWPGIWRGVKTIAVPDITGSLTIVAVFVPLLFVGGLAGLFFIPFALAMTSALLASLLVSLTLIPLGLGFTGARPHAGTTSGGRLLERLRQANGHVFNWVARRPRTSLGVTFAVLALSIAGLALVTVNFLPLPNEGCLLESFTLPPGSSLVDAEQAVGRMTKRLLADPAVAHVFARIGSAATTAYTEPSYAGEIQIALKPAVNANTLDAIGSRITRETTLTGVQTALDTPTVERLGESLSGLPQPFVIQVFGGDVTRLRAYAESVAQRLLGLRSISDVFNNDAYPISEVQVTPRPAALAAHHLTAAQLYTQLQPLLAGEVVASVPEGNVPLSLFVRLADAPDRSLRALDETPIRTETWTPLDELAEVQLVTTPNQLRHIDGARALEILATPTGLGGLREARAAVGGLSLPTGYRVAFSGLYPDLERAAVALGVAIVAAFGLMIGILALQFEGMLIPGLLLLEVPLALMGGAIGLIVSCVGLNVTGLVAFLTLIGIGLSHGIVLLDRARRNELEGMSVEDAVRDAIQVRFRPIVLTTLTAALGMLPTAVGWGQGAAPEQGLAVVILGGVLWSAVRSTNLIPALYIHWRRKQLAREATR